ncbi:MAG: hypothetical protein EGP83_10765 [Clostridiales bacterium]|nr:hypothetical protein [Clostridiales bacterium]
MVLQAKTDLFCRGDLGAYPADEQHGIQTHGHAVIALSKTGGGGGSVAGEDQAGLSRGVTGGKDALQRRLAQETPMLVDGRDIGTRVLMNAPVKIFLTASAEERARRRYQEMVNKGMDANFDDVLRDLRARDEQDTHRAVDPLRAAEDAVTVDSTHLTFDEVVEAILRIVADKTGGAWA